MLIVVVEYLKSISISAFFMPFMLQYQYQIFFNSSSFSNMYANTMEELLYATDACIRFLEYMNQPIILISCCIQIEDKLIRPITASGQDPKQVRKNALYQYYNPIFSN